MPLHLLRRKLEIYNGDRHVILELLRQIRKVGPLSSSLTSRNLGHLFITLGVLIRQAYGHHHLSGAQPNSVVKPSPGGAAVNTKPS